MAARCWAYSPTGNRCSKSAGNHTKHTAREEWDDGESIDPTSVAPTQRTVTTRPPQPAFPDPDAAEEPAPGRCFACGCTEAAHSATEDGCIQHSCRGFVP